MVFFFFTGLVSRLWVVCVPWPLHPPNPPATPMDTNCVASTIVNTLPLLVLPQLVLLQRVHLHWQKGLIGVKNFFVTGLIWIFGLQCCLSSFNNYFIWIFGLIFWQINMHTIFYLFLFIRKAVSVFIYFLFVCVCKIFVGKRKKLQRKCIPKDL